GRARWAGRRWLGRAAAGRGGAVVSSRDFERGKVSVAAARLMGGCAMGRGGRDSVADAWGRVHGVPWLRVADASLFPNALEINPYLTIMALAGRGAEGLRAERGARAAEAAPGGVP